MLNSFISVQYFNWFRCTVVQSPGCNCKKKSFKNVETSSCTAFKKKGL